MSAKGAPPIQVDATACERPHVAEAPEQTALGYPSERTSDWHTRALGRLGELVAGNRALRLAMDGCMHCGACTDQCHYFLGSGDPLNMPVARQELMRSVYRRHFTWAGRLLPWLVGARELDEQMLQSWYTYFHQCSQCRRCAVFCPIGIDTAEVSMAARDIMAEIGLGQRYSHTVIEKVHRFGNNLGMPEPALRDTLRGLEEDLYEDAGVNIRLPLDEAGADVLLVVPSADFFAEPHVDGLLGYAKVFHQAGISFTFSTHAGEAANFGLFIGSKEHTQLLVDRICEAARELRVQRIVFGECGHAWRVAQSSLRHLAHQLPSLNRAHALPSHMAEVTYELLRRGALRIDRTRNDHRRMTFHDSCNIARGSTLGGQAHGQFVIPRKLLRAVAQHVFEMSADTVKERTFCCGAGGGLLTDELLRLRELGASPRIHAFAASAEAHQLTHLVAMCAICKSQFTKILPAYGFEFDQVLSLHQVVGDALVF